MFLVGPSNGLLLTLKLADEFYVDYDLIRRGRRGPNLG